MALSEYSRIASVLSSCAGSGAAAAACIHGGASAPRTLPAAASRQSAPSTRTRPRRPLVAGTGCTRLQDDLLFIIGPHYLKEVAQGRVVFLLEYQNVHIQEAFQVQRALIVFGFHLVSDKSGALLRQGRQRPYPPAWR